MASGSPDTVLRGVVLVGHGGVPRDYPRARVTRLKQLEAARRGTGAPPTAEEQAIERELRTWPRTPATDPYQAGLEALAAALRPLLAPARLVVAYNEFCAPTLEEAVEGLVGAGIGEIAVVPTMLTPGGIHSEVEIPAAVAALQARHPDVRLRYAWPVDVGLVARMLAAHLVAAGGAVSR